MNPTRLLPYAAVTATAVLGALATRPQDPWYRSLDKPSWQPPPPVFGLVWTPLYTLLAYSGSRVWPRLRGADQRRYAAAYTANLALNAGWTWLFFRRRRPDAALAESLLLQASNLDLLRRSRAVDRSAAAALVPYAAWTGFAIALNAAIVRRNPAARPRSALHGSWTAHTSPGRTPHPAPARP